MKKNVAVLFGGQSTEHAISRRSVQMILNHIDRSKYRLYLIGITELGAWRLYEGDQANIEDGTWEKTGVPAVLSPDATQQVLLVERANKLDKIKIDVVLPVLHGLYGEDGSIQGLCQLAKIPYVGCGILASAVSMDKFYTKLVVEPLGIRQADYVKVYRDVYNKKEVEKAVATQLGYPVFIKPSNAGSSIGVSKVDNKEALDSALKKAFLYDRKVLVEESILGREVECGVLGNLEVEVTDVGEILTEEAFYDFDAKYNNPTSRTILSAEIPEETRRYIQEASSAIFKAVDGRGLARVDFFIETTTGDVVFNEINTFPGLTEISMYPMLFEATGLSARNLIDRLIELAIEIDEV